MIDIVRWLPVLQVICILVLMACVIVNRQAHKHLKAAIAKVQEVDGELAKKMVEVHALHMELKIAAERLNRISYAKAQGLPIPQEDIDFLMQLAGEPPARTH